MFREPLLLYYRYSRSVADIAESMQMTEEAIRQRLSRGRKLLKAEVEKQVENVLESTRPDTAFTLAVLAAIPLAATVSGCAGAATSQSIGLISGGTALGGPGIILAILTILLLLLFQSTSMILLAVVTFYALWQAIRRAPTLKIRRLIINAALDFNLLLWGWYFIRGFLLSPLFNDGSFSRSTTMMYVQSLSLELRSFLFLGLPMFLLFSAFVVYVVVQWQQLLREELRDREPFQFGSLSPNRGILFDDQRQFLRRIQRMGGLWLKRRQSAERLQIRWKICRNLVIICIAVLIGYNVWNYIRLITSSPNEPVSYPSLSVIAFLIASSLWDFLLQIGIQVVFFKITSRGITISRDQETFLQTSSQKKADADTSAETSSVVRYDAMRDMVVLLLAVPYAMMLLAFVLGVIHPFSDGSFISIPIITGSFFLIVQIVIVLVMPTVFWISRNPEKRYTAFSIFFLVTGLFTVIMLEWPLVHEFLSAHLQTVLFWWMPESDKSIFTINLADIQANAYWTFYLYWHIFAMIWLVYSVAAALFFRIYRIRHEEQPSV